MNIHPSKAQQHNHVTRDIKPQGKCPACDGYWKRTEQPDLQGEHLVSKLKEHADTPAPKPTIYIAGPMTGHPGSNYAAFNQAAYDLRALGYTILNPAENPAPKPDPNWQDWMRAAIAQLIQADGIALLPLWYTSEGAAVEHRLGKGLGLDVRRIHDWLPTSTTHTVSRYTPALPVSTK